MAAGMEQVVSRAFELEFDEPALRWLQSRLSHLPLVISYRVTRCCSGPPVREVRLRQLSHPSQGREGLIQIGTVLDRAVLLDARIAGSMPPRIPVSAGGIGRFRGLRLNLSADEWARLLYP
ncbi:MAG: hypothetical protein WCB85_02660 [Candidatus Dormiibacterota bacterium]